MLAAAWYHLILAVLFAFLAIILMGVILLQRGRGVGLAGAFGGAGGHTAFGAKTGDVLTWATVVITGILLLYIVILNYVFVPPSASFGGPAIAPTDGGAETTPAAPAPKAPAAPASSPIKLTPSGPPPGVVPMPAADKPASAPPTNPPTSAPAASDTKPKEEPGSGNG